MAPALIPRSASWRASRSAPWRVRQNTMAGEAAAIASAHASTRSALSVDQNRCSAAVMSGRSSPSELVADRVALVVADQARRRRRRASPRRAASGGRRRTGSSRRRTSGRKPMSAMRSASSITTAVDVVEVDVAAGRRGRRAGRDRRRAMSTPRRRACELRARSRRRRRRRRPTAASAGAGPQLGGDLRGELAGRDEHEARAVGGAGPARPGTRGGCRRRWSCPSRSGPGRRRRARRGRRGWWPPGWGTAR